MPGVVSEADRHEARRNGGDWIDSAQAAVKLGCSRRQVCKLLQTLAEGKPGAVTDQVLDTGK